MTEDERHLQYLKKDLNWWQYLGHEDRAKAIEWAIDEIARLRAFNASLTERVAAQSELLAKRAERLD